MAEIMKFSYWGQIIMYHCVVKCHPFPWGVCRCVSVPGTTQKCTCVIAELTSVSKLHQRRRFLATLTKSRVDMIRFKLFLGMNKTENVCLPHQYRALEVPLHMQHQTVHPESSFKRTDSLPDVSVNYMLSHGGENTKRACSLSSIPHLYRRWEAKQRWLFNVLFYQ